MPNQEFSYDFKVFLEGVEIPNHGFRVSITPNNSTASIDIYSNNEAHDIKPKTAVQIFYRDFVTSKDAVDGKTWRIMFDGYVSGISEMAQGSQGRSMSLTARDFRADLAKVPAVLTYKPFEDTLSKTVFNNLYGINKEFSLPGSDKKINIYGEGAFGRDYDSSDVGLESNGLTNLVIMLKYIAGSALGDKVDTDKAGARYNGIEDSFVLDNDGKVNGGLFIDSLARGLWLESTSGTTYGAMINKRMRADKKLMVSSNVAGYNFWSRYNAAGQIGTYIFGNAHYTSVEAVIMRVAGLFQARVYSCSTPSYIKIDKESKASKYVIDDKVRDFIVDKEVNFGQKAVLNQAMILPPLEFTAPPNCNLILPAMYDNVQWQHDYDNDVTRGSYDIENIDMGAGQGANEWFSDSIQVPNAIANVDYKGLRSTLLTLDERYSGVNVDYGTVKSSQGFDEIGSSEVKDAKDKVEAEKFKAKAQNLTRGLTSIKNSAPLSSKQKGELKSAMEAKMAAINNAERGAPESAGFEHRNALKRHGLIKFMNSRYLGRVAQVNMVFNPYIMSGFPATIVAGLSGEGSKFNRDIIGSVQQITHSVVKFEGGGEASTSVVLNMPRYVDEPTDIDEFGDKLYLPATVPNNARVTDLMRDESIPEPITRTCHDVREDEAYAIKRNTLADSMTLFAKDFLSLTDSDRAEGKLNRVYLDKIYEPQNIAKYYNELFGLDSLMIGRAADGLGGEYKFSYNTIHEAVETFKVNNPEIYVSLEDSLRIVYRKVCTPDEMYAGILGCSVRDLGAFRVKSDDEFDAADIRREYYGVSDEEFNSGKESIEVLKASNGGLMSTPGEFSSISENRPVTAFIKERKDAVKNYINSIESDFTYVSE